MDALSAYFLITPTSLFINLTSNASSNSRWALVGGRGGKCCGLIDLKVLGAAGRGRQHDHVTAERFANYLLFCISILKGCYSHYEIPHRPLRYVQPVWYRELPLLLEDYRSLFENRRRVDHGFRPSSQRPTDTRYHDRSGQVYRSEVKWSIAVTSVGPISLEAEMTWLQYAALTWKPAFSISTYMPC